MLSAGPRLQFLVYIMRWEELKETGSCEVFYSDWIRTWSLNIVILISLLIPKKPPFIEYLRYSDAMIQGFEFSPSSLCLFYKCGNNWCPITQERWPGNSEPGLHDSKFFHCISKPSINTWEFGDRCSREEAKRDFRKAAFLRNLITAASRPSCFSIQQF